MTTTHTTSDLARITVHYCPDVLARDEYGDVLGPTTCGIPAGTYGTTQLEHVTCPDCIADTLAPISSPSGWEY
jgi:hypothetical protein